MLCTMAAPSAAAAVAAAAAAAVFVLVYEVLSRCVALVVSFLFDSFTSFAFSIYPVAN